MEKQFQYKNHVYWITVKSTIHQITGSTVFIAYVSDKKPSPLYFGTPARDSNGEILLCGSELSALINANAIKQSEIDNI